MFKKIGKAIPVIGLFFWIGGCATLDKDTQRPVASEPVVSKTISESAPETSAQGLKRKVAIARFSNETRYGQSFFLDENNDKIGKQCVDILTAKLMDTEKFIVLERADLAKIEQELELGNAGKIDNMADYLIVGSVSEFGRKDQSEVGIFSRVKKQIAFAKVHIRLIEVRTGKVVYSEEGEAEAYSEAGTVFGVGERSGYDATLNDKALEAAIGNLSSNIIENLLDKPWRSYILGFQNDLLIISGGASQNISPGMSFLVMRQGKTVRNPQTNMELVLPGTPIGTIRVEETLGDTPENEISLCSVQQGDISTYLRSGDFSKLYIKQTEEVD